MKSPLAKFTPFFSWYPREAALEINFPPHSSTISLVSSVEPPSTTINSLTIPASIPSNKLASVFLTVFCEFNVGITIDIGAISYDQDFVSTDAAHPDNGAADLTIKAIWYNNGTAATTQTITAGSGDGISLGSLDTTGFLEFEVTGIEEGCELTISYDLNNNSDSIDGQTDKISVAPVKGLNNCDFQSVLKYQQFNQKINNRFDADTKEFSSFKDMLKRMKKVK